MHDLKSGPFYDRFMHYAPGFWEELEWDLQHILTPRETSLMSKSVPDIAPNDRRGFRDADMIALLSDRASGEPFYLVVEVSLTASLRHADLVRRNARFLTEVTGTRAIPAIVSASNTQEVQSLIDAGEIQWLQMEDRYRVVEE